MNTIGDVIESIRRLQLKLAVMDETLNYLTTFVATDSHEPKSGIASPIGGDVVPQDVIEEVRDDYVKQRSAVEAEIEKLRGKRLPGTASKKPSARPVRVAPKRRKSNVNKKKK